MCKKLFFLVQTVLFAGFVNAQTGHVDMIELSDAASISVVKKIDVALSSMTDKVMSCINNKLAEPAVCACKYPEQLSLLKSAYDNALLKHSEWKEKLVHYMDAENNMSHNLNFMGLRRQFEMTCK